MEIINTDTHLAWEGNILEYVNDGHDEEIGIICPDHAIFAMQIVRAMFEPPDWDFFSLSGFFIDA